MRVTAETIPCFCRGEASGNGVTGEPTHIMPDASPLPHGTWRGALYLRADRNPALRRHDIKVTFVTVSGCYTLLYYVCYKLI